MELKSKIEAILAAAGKPLTYEAIALLSGVSQKEASDALHALKREYDRECRGIRIVTNGNSAELSTAPECAAVVLKLIKEEETAMTQAQIETLSILAYRGPLTRGELENIRGVNCAVILKNLKIEGLIEECSASADHLYNVSTLFLKGLGVERQDQLPEYNELNQKITV